MNSSAWVSYAEEHGERKKWKLFVEFISDLQIVITGTKEVIQWMMETDNDHRKREHLARLAIIYIAFAARATVDLRAHAGKLTKNYNEFAEQRHLPLEPLRFPEKGRTKRLNAIIARVKSARNMIAHPYRVESEGKELPINVFQALFLHAVIADAGALASEVKEVSDAWLDLDRWWREAFVRGICV